MQMPPLSQAIGRHRIGGGSFASRTTTTTTTVRSPFQSIGGGGGSNVVRRNSAGVGQFGGFGLPSSPSSSLGGPVVCDPSKPGSCDLPGSGGGAPMGPATPGPGMGSSPAPAPAPGPSAGPSGGGNRLIEVTQPSCSHCMAQKPITDSVNAKCGGAGVYIEEVNGLAEGASYVNNYGVTTTPTFLLLSPSGSLIQKIEGNADAGTLTGLIAANGVTCKSSGGGGVTSAPPTSGGGGYPGPTSPYPAGPYSSPSPGPSTTSPYSPYNPYQSIGGGGGTRRLDVKDLPPSTRQTVTTALLFSTNKPQLQNLARVLKQSGYVLAARRIQGVIDALS